MESLRRSNALRCVNSNPAGESTAPNNWIPCTNDAPFETTKLRRTQQPVWSVQKRLSDVGVTGPQRQTIYSNVGRDTRTEVKDEYRRRSEMGVPDTRT